MNQIPESFFDLVDCPRVAALTTVMPDGQPQTTVVWCDFDGQFACINTTLERQAQETRIICRIKPTRINLDAIHK